MKGWPSRGRSNLGRVGDTLAQGELADPKDDLRRLQFPVLIR